MKIRKLWIIISVIIVLIISLFLIFNNLNHGIITNNLFNSQKIETASTTIKLESKEEDKVLVILENEAGLNKVKTPNGTSINCYGNKVMAIDYIVEPDKTYTFEATDKLNNVSNLSFITPTTHIEMTKNDIEIDLEEAKSLICQKLNEHLIATNFMDIGAGEKSYVSSQATDMRQVFNGWQSFGDGQWSYDSSTKTVLNSKNSDYFTGYYYPNGDFDDIELSFNAKTTDGDDDMIGAMVRFSASGSMYNSYLFLLDRHDNGGGIGNGAFNGLNKIQGKDLVTAGSNLGGTFTKLSVNSGLRWSRNQWQNYKIIAKGNNIKAYIDNVLVAEANDSSIKKGTYGFLSYSQANTYFKDIVISTNKLYSLTELLEKRTWKLDNINVVINLNNMVESSLDDQSCEDIFNNNNIHYLAIGSETNKTSSENFISQINNRGKWIESTDYEAYITGVVDYISSIY